MMEGLLHSVVVGLSSRMVTVNALVVLGLLAPCLALVNQDRQESTARAPWNATWTDTLKRSLLAGYDKFARPSHHLVSTNVTVQLTINHVEIEDESGVMTVHGWIKMAWNDDKLVWNATDYGGLHTLHIADHEIWQPDIVQYNSASGSQVDQYGNTNCLVGEKGDVLWVPPTKLTAFCDLDLTYWPSDEHTCELVFGSWTYDSIQIYLLSGESVDDEGNVVLENFEHYVENGRWELIKVNHRRVEKTYPCCGDAIYASIHYDVTVRRRGGGARGTLVRAPAVVSGLLTLLGHTLPVKAPLSARLPLMVAPPTILSLSLLYFSYLLPPANNTPNIIILYSIILYMVCLSSVVSLVVLNMATGRKALPWAVRRVLCSRAARCLRLPKLADASAGEELQGTAGNASGGVNVEEGAQMLSGASAPARDWLALATAIDRIFFIILLAVLIITACIYDENNENQKPHLLHSISIEKLKAVE